VLGVLLQAKRSLIGRMDPSPGLFHRRRLIVETPVRIIQGGEEVEGVRRLFDALLRLILGLGGLGRRSLDGRVPRGRILLSPPPGRSRREKDDRAQAPKSEKAKVSFFPPGTGAVPAAGRLGRTEPTGRSVLEDRQAHFSSPIRKIGIPQAGP
jgi:hypothetical protein